MFHLIYGHAMMSPRFFDTAVLHSPISIVGYLWFVCCCMVGSAWLTLSAQTHSIITSNAMSNAMSNATSTVLLPRIAEYLAQCETLFHTIDQTRKAELERLTEFVASQAKQPSAQASQPSAAHLIFICTHNSRRSHFAQIWAKVAADYYGVQGVATYSGGTEVSAFHKNAIHTLQTIGFEITTSQNVSENNPLYSVRYSTTLPVLQAFSKKYNDAYNPQQNFCAVMTCSQADQACPFVVGAIERIALPYDDPKLFDNTTQQDSKYAERCRHIATEMLYVFSRVRLHIR